MKKDNLKQLKELIKIEWASLDDIRKSHDEIFKDFKNENSKNKPK